jgi:hypothetical protein
MHPDRQKATELSDYPVWCGINKLGCRETGQARHASDSTVENYGLRSA